MAERHNARMKLSSTLAPVDRAYEWQRRRVRPSAIHYVWKPASQHCPAIATIASGPWARTAGGAARQDLRAARARQMGMGARLQAWIDALRLRQRRDGPSCAPGARSRVAALGKTGSCSRLRARKGRHDGPRRSRPLAHRLPWRRGHDQFRLESRLAPHDRQFAAVRERVHDARRLV